MDFSETDKTSINNLKEILTSKIRYKDFYEVFFNTQVLPIDYTNPLDQSLIQDLSDILGMLKNQIRVSSFDISPNYIYDKGVSQYKRRISIQIESAIKQEMDLNFRFEYLEKRQLPHFDLAFNYESDASNIINYVDLKFFMTDKVDKERLKDDFSSVYRGFFSKSLKRYIETHEIPPGRHLVIIILLNQDINSEIDSEVIYDFAIYDLSTIMVQPELRYNFNLNDMKSVDIVGVQY